MAESPIRSESALSLLEYPSRFPLKVFGDNAGNFEFIVLELIRTRCPQNEHIAVSRRISRNGKYLALTLTFTAYSQDQIEKIYQDLSDCTQVVMSL